MSLIRTPSGSSQAIVAPGRVLLRPPCLARSCGGRTRVGGGGCVGACVWAGGYSGGCYVVIRVGGWCCVGARVGRRGTVGAMSALLWTSEKRCVLCGRSQMGGGRVGACVGDERLTDGGYLGVRARKLRSLFVSYLWDNFGILLAFVWGIIPIGFVSVCVVRATKDVYYLLLQ